MRYVIMFHNNRYFKEGAIFRRFPTPTGRYGTFDGAFKYKLYTKEEIEALEEPLKLKRMEQLERLTTMDLQKARIFDSKAAAANAASRGGYSSKNGDFTVIQVNLTLNTKE